jgi:hypothetical protein
MVSILVKMREGQQKAFLEKLEEIRRGGDYLFPGSAARYIAGNDARPDEVRIILIWRASVMPEEKERQAAIEALKHELADVLDWEQVRYTYGRVFMHT